MAAPQRAAEAEALRRCNAEAAPFNDGPCVLYAVGAAWSCRSGAPSP